VVDELPGSSRRVRGRSDDRDDGEPGDTRFAEVGQMTLLDSANGHQWARRCETNRSFEGHDAPCRIFRRLRGGPEDRPEGNVVDVLFPCRLELGGGMCRAPDREVFARCFRELVRREISLSEMHRIRVREECEVESIVDDETRSGCPSEGANRMRPIEDLLVGGVLRSQLDDRCAPVARRASLLDRVSHPARIVIGKHVQSMVVVGAGSFLQGSCSASGRKLDLEFRDLLAQGISVDAENRGRFDLIAQRLLENGLE
jgi:hypothetical protein